MTRARGQTRRFFLWGVSIRNSLRSNNFESNTKSLKSILVVPSQIDSPKSVLPPDENINPSESTENVRGHGCNIGERLSEVGNENETFLRYSRPFKVYARRRGQLGIILGLD